MPDLTTRLREMGREVEGRAGPLPLRPSVVRRIRLRQFATLSLTGLLAVGLALAFFAGWQLAASGAKSSGTPVRPGGSIPPTVITSVEIPGTGVGVQTWTATALVDDEGAAIRLDGSPETDWTEVRLPIAGKMWARDFWNGRGLEYWGVIGVVTSEAARVVIVFDNAPAIEAKLFALPEELGDLQVFAAEAGGGVAGHEIRVENASGEVIASEYRPAPTLPPVP